jgi:tryptophanyl-tRNA synthetase
MATARTAYLQDGNAEALQAAREILAASQNLGVADRERLAGWLENKGKTILPEPEAKLTAASRMPGLDGQKMSKSYGNTITMRESPELVSKKVKAMPTDPARVRRTDDAGNPEKCPVWQLHQVYSDNDTREWVKKGCTSAGIGCLECKQPVIDGVLREQQPMFERAEQYLTHPDRVKNRVRRLPPREKVAKETMGDVRAAMGLGFWAQRQNRICGIASCDVSQIHPMKIKKSRNRRGFFFVGCFQCSSRGKNISASMQRQLPPPTASMVGMGLTTGWP